MAVTAEDIKMRIIAENAADRAVKQFATSIKNVDKGVGRLSGNLKALGGIAVGAFAVQGLRKMNDFVGESIKLANAQADAERKVADVIRATGGAAGFTADEIYKMASSYQASTKFGDEAILEMQSVLLTFKNVTGDVFEEATGAVLDMATVMGTDAKSAAIQLGKALNDPVLGASAMSRAGIQFTEAQKDMMKEMVATNRIAEAQRMILDEIAGQMGGAAAGAAETYSGKVEQLSNKYGDMKEQIGFAVLESGAFDAVLDALNPAVDELTQYIADHKEDIGEFAAHLGNMAGDAIKNAPGYIEAITTNIKGLYDAVVPLVDLVAENPEMAKYGIIGGLLFGPAGAALGSTMGYMKQVGDNVDKAMGGSPWEKFLSELEALEAQKQAWQEYSSGVREAEIHQEQMLARTLAKMASAADKMEDSGDKVKGLGKASKDAARALKEQEKAVLAAEEWYAKEYEAYEGMFEAEKKYRREMDHLHLLYDQGKIGIEAFTDAAIDSANKLSEKYMFGQFLGYDYVYDENGDPAPRGYDRDRSGITREEDPWNFIADGLSNLQSVLQYGGIEVHGLSSFAEAARSYGVYINPPQGQDANPADLYNAIGAVGVGVGQMVGGRVGGVISSTAGMASAGASLGAALATGGGPYGAAIGAAIGLVSSIFGGGDDEERRARRNEARQEAFNAIQDMALSGGPLSAELMRRSDWSWQGLSGLRHTDDLADEFGVWWPERLMADNGVEGIADRQEMIAAIDNLLLSIKSFTDSGFSQSLDQLNIKYEYLAEKSHNLALVEEARLTELIQLVTGINADSVVSSISSAMSAAASQGGDAGEIFVQNFTNEILDGVANTAISQMVTNTVMPILEEPLSRIAESMTAGEGFDTSALAEAVSLAQSAAASVAPAVQELYAAFDEADMWASDIKRAGSAWSAMIEQVTGLSAQTVGSQILQSIETVASQGGNIGKTFVNGFMQSVQDGLKKVAIDELMTGTINSILAPAMQHITESVTGGGGGGNANALNKGLIRNALEDAKMAAESVVPIIEEVYDVFKESGLLKDSYGTTKSAYVVDATEEQIREAIAQAKLDWDANVQPLHDRIKELEAEMEKAIIGAAPRGLGYSPRESVDALTAAAKSLEEYRSDLVVAELGSALGYEQMLMNQKSVVSELAADAMGGTTDSRIAAMQDLPSALRGYLGSVKSMATDPKEYAREVARAQALLQGVEREAGLTEQQRTTDEIKQLREEMNRMSLTLARHTSQAAQILKRWEMSGFEVTETT